MARIVGIKNTKMLLVKPLSGRQGFVFGRCMNKLARQDHREHTNKDLEGVAAAADEPRPTVDIPASCWMPDPRTGIYFPKGHEWVMDDVPNGAASFDCTFWLRGIDGVDDHDKLSPHNILAPLP